VPTGTPLGQREICPGIHSTSGAKKYHFASASILMLFSCIKMLNIAAFKSVFTTKNPPKCFAG